MSRWTVTLTDPLNTLPPLILANFGESGYSRSSIQRLKLEQFSAAGAPVLTGRVSQTRYSWELAVMVPEAQSLHLEAFVELQDDRYAARQDGAILLTDEFEYLPPRSTPNKTLLTGSQRTIAGMITGFGIFKVKLQVPEQSKTHQGLDTGTNSPMKLIHVSAIELPEI